MIVLLSLPSALRCFSSKNACKQKQPKGLLPLSSSNIERESEIIFEAAHKCSKTSRTDDGFSSETASATYVVK